TRQNLPQRRFQSLSVRLINSEKQSHCRIFSNLPKPTWQRSYTATACPGDGVKTRKCDVGPPVAPTVANSKWSAPTRNHVLRSSDAIRFYRTGLVGDESERGAGHQ